MSDQAPDASAAPPGLPEPPPVGTTALPPGTYDGDTVVVTGGGSVGATCS